MSYALIDVEITGQIPSFRLGDEHAGVGIVSRRNGRVVGFALHALVPGVSLGPDDVEALLDPSPVASNATRAPGPARPSLTVAICTRNRTDLLRDCLTGLLALDDQPDEILVVDNAPTDDRTRALANELGVRYEIEPCPGLDFARNRVLTASCTDIIAFVDDDVVVDRYWLESLRAVWCEHPDAGMMTGQILPFELETAAQIAFEERGGFRGGNETICYEGQHRSGDPIYPYGPGMFGAGANMSIRREVALRLGGFDEALDTGPPLPGGGDIDMMHRVLRSGFALVYEPRAVVFHRHRRDWTGLRKQYDSWGRSLMAFAAKTFRLDPEGRPKLRKLVRWFYVHQLREARRRPTQPPTHARSAAIAELKGGTIGLLGTYRRSQRRTRRRRRDHGNPTVAILPWGDLVEDYIDPLGLSLDDYAERLSGGWLFGFAEGFAKAGVDTVVVCWSRSVTRPTRRIHAPTGAVIWFLPPSRTYVRARARLANVYAWSLREAVDPGLGRGAVVVAAFARMITPYLTTTPRALARVLRRETCDAVLCQEYEEGRFDVCVALGRVLRIPVFATFQGGDHTRTRIERWLRWPAVHAAAGLIVAAESEAERVRARYRIAPERIARIANPLDPATVIRRPRAEARAALGIQPDARVVVWDGRVDIRPKGIDTLIDAWCEVRAARMGSVVLLLLGTGSGSEWLHQRLAELGLDDVQWRDEYVLDRAVIGTYLSAADVFVLPSRQEGLPVAPLEAMTAGLPVVAADAPGVRAVLGDGDTAGGTVVACDDPHALATELGRLLDDPELRERIGARAERRARDAFSLDAIGVELRSFVIDRGRR
jgi:glycosyltransferase involved in cell wall biosynthesis/GT2 family glycosyltransferase